MGSEQMCPPTMIKAGPLELRRMSVRDGPAAAAAISASLDELRPWMPWATEEAATERAQQARAEEVQRLWEDGSDYIYLAYLSGDEAVIGSFGLHRRLDAAGIEIGYWVNTAYSGNGYATEGARALTSTALRLPHIERVEIHCDKGNVRSSAVPERLGYRLDRTEARELTAPGESGKHLIWVYP